MITDRDIAVRAVAEGRGPDTKVRDVMSREIRYCYEDQIDRRSHAQHGRACACVVCRCVNRDKRLVGILSLGDLAIDETAQDEAGEALGGILAARRPALAVGGKALVAHQIVHAVRNGGEADRVVDLHPPLRFADHPRDAEAAGEVVLLSHQRAVFETRAREHVVAHIGADPVLRGNRFDRAVSTCVPEYPPRASYAGRSAVANVGATE